LIFHYAYLGLLFRFLTEIPNQLSVGLSLTLF